MADFVNVSRPTLDACSRFTDMAAAVVSPQLPQRHSQDEADPQVFTMCPFWASYRLPTSMPPPFSIQFRPILDAVSVSIAARDINKAKAQAAEFSVPETYGTDDELLVRSDVESLPNGLHAEWAIKHVLNEKPIASNADEVRQIQARAKETGKIVLEAFHWQFHPAAHVVKGGSSTAAAMVK